MPLLKARKKYTKNILKKLKYLIQLLLVNKGLKAQPRQNSNHHSHPFICLKL
jgi:hypothetical protein